ncbi:MAG: hypothetical protein WHT06_06915 [Desulfobacterales bacterium]
MDDPKAPKAEESSVHENALHSFLEDFAYHAPRPAVKNRAGFLYNLAGVITFQIENARIQE